jgi:hypothetical protein
MIQVAIYFLFQYKSLIFSKLPLIVLTGLLTILLEFCDFRLQLRKWGWMHHLARHAVACYLTRGDLVSRIFEFDELLTAMVWHKDIKISTT